MLSRLGSLFALATAATAFSTPKATPAVKMDAAANVGVAQKAFAAAAASASLAFALVGSPLEASATSKTAGQISLNSIPPTSVKVDVRDLPVIGDVLSGTYTRVSDASDKSPASVSIISPKDKVGAIRAAATGGHLEFDVDGLVATHLDIDVAADEAGVLTARVSSPLIPKLPFKNAASSAPKVGGKASDWSSVTNLGDGKVYYYNSKTDETTYQKPETI